MFAREKRTSNQPKPENDSCGVDSADQQNSDLSGVEGISLSRINRGLSEAALVDAANINVGDLTPAQIPFHEVTTKLIDTWKLDRATKVILRHAKELGEHIPTLAQKLISAAQERSKEQTEARKASEYLNKMSLILDSRTIAGLLHKLTKDRSLSAGERSSLIHEHSKRLSKLTSPAAREIITELMEKHSWPAAERYWDDFSHLLTEEDQEFLADFGRRS